MKNVIQILIFLCSTLHLSAQGSYFDASILKDPTGYKLRPGDRIKVFVQGEDDCTAESDLSSDGSINLPYIGDIRVIGKNKKDAEVTIQQAYVNELIFARPKVILSIIKYTERVVFEFTKFFKLLFFELTFNRTFR